MHHTPSDDCTNHNDEKRQLLMFRKKPSKGSTEEGPVLGLNSGCLIILAVWLFKECKGASGAHPRQCRGIFPMEIAFQLHNF